MDKATSNVLIVSIKSVCVGVCMFLALCIDAIVAKTISNDIIISFLCVFVVVCVVVFFFDRYIYILNKALLIVVLLYCLISISLKQFQFFTLMGTHIPKKLNYFYMYKKYT